jgi:uncharacterized cupredoxin-like copper-binding protein
MPVVTIPLTRVSPEVVSGERRRDTSTGPSPLTLTTSRPRWFGRSERVLLLVGCCALIAVLAACGADPDPTLNGAPGCLTATALHHTAAQAKPPVDVLIGGLNDSKQGRDVVPCRASAAAGDVTFVVKNVGTEDHELIVLRTNTTYYKLPVTDAGDPPAPVQSDADKVDESASVGETGGENLHPGETRTFTIKAMKPGRYVLLCNLADHYMTGMSAPFQILAPQDQGAERIGVQPLLH